MARKETPTQTAARLEREINESLAGVRTMRRTRDSMDGGERVPPSRVLGRVDVALSDAQDQLSNLLTAEVRASSPQVHKLADSYFDAIDKIRHRIRAAR